MYHRLFLTGAIILDTSPSALLTDVIFEGGTSIPLKVEI